MRLLWVAVLAALAMACVEGAGGDIKDVLVTDGNQAQLYDRIQKDSELTGEEVRLLQAHIDRLGLESRLPVGKTVGDIIAEQRGFESRGATLEAVDEPETANDAQTEASAAATAGQPRPERPAEDPGGAPPRPPSTQARPPQTAAPRDAPPPTQAAAADEASAPPLDEPPEEIDRPPTHLVVPVGTNLELRLEEALSSKTHRAGDTFAASLSKDLVVDGWLIAPRGSRVTGKVASARPSGKVKGLAQLSLTLQGIRVHDDSYPLRTTALSFEAQPTKKEDAKKVGIGAGAGAVIGGILGGKKGAAIGGAVGAAGGTGVVLATSGDEVEFEVEQPFVFELKAAVEMRILGR